MYRFVCFILLVSLEGLKANNTNNSLNNLTDTTPKINISDITSINAPDLITKTSENPSSSSVTATPKPGLITSTYARNIQSYQTTMVPDCLFNLKDSKETFLFLIISLLLLICLLMLVIICLVCKCSRGTRNEGLVVMKSSTIRRNSVNGGPSETDIMLDCGPVKVEIETGLEESQEPEKVGGATAEVENRVPGEEYKNSANKSGEVAPTHEVQQAGEPDEVKEDLEKAE